MSSAPALYKTLELPKGSIANHFEREGIRMTVIHNCIIRGLNAILYHAPTVSGKRLRAFMKFCLQLASGIEHHHHTEEELYFVKLEEKMGAGTMGSNVNAHHEFKKPFTAWIELCTVVQKDTTKYNSEEFIGTIQAFAPILIEHLKEEINTLNPETLKRHLSVEDLEHIERLVEAKVKKESSLVWGFPVIMCCNDKITGGWFPPVPKFLIWIIRTFLYPMHSDVWEFAPSDKYMNVKPEFLSAEVGRT